VNWAGVGRLAFGLVGEFQVVGFVDSLNCNLISKLDSLCYVSECRSV